MIPHPQNKTPTLRHFLDCLFSGPVQCFEWGVALAQRPWLVGAWSLLSADGRAGPGDREQNVLSQSESLGHKSLALSLSKVWRPQEWVWILEQFDLVNQMPTIVWYINFWMIRNPEVRYKMWPDPSPAVSVPLRPLQPGLCCWVQRADPFLCLLTSLPSLIHVRNCIFLPNTDKSELYKNLNINLPKMKIS